MKTALLGGFVLLQLLALEPHLSADNIVFTIDPSKSSVAISGNVVGAVIQEQASGSLTTKYSGTIVANLTGTTIQFPGGSKIVAENNGTWQPGVGGAVGSAPGNYGGLASASLASAQAAVRNIQLDVFSPDLPVNSGSFAAQGLAFQFLTNSPASLDYVLSSFLGTVRKSEALAGYTTNQIATQATIATTGGVQTLTLPVNAGIAFQVLTPNDTLLTLAGQLVATSGGSSVTAPAIGSIVVSNQVVTLQWQATPGKQYQVQSTPDLKNWTTRASGLSATSNTLTWSTSASQLLEFFRLAQ